VANITVTVTGIPSVVVTVTQAGAGANLSVTPGNQNVTAPAGNTSFNVTSNSFWNASSAASWCTVTPSGSGSGSLTANYEANNSASSRTAIITVTVTGLTPVNVTVTQAGAAPTLAVSPDSQTVPYDAGVTTFNVTSNSDWTASCPSAWCTVTPNGTGNGTIDATYEENPSTSTRVAEITVNVPGLSSQVVQVIQLGFVGIKDESGKTIELYPNPTTGIFTISGANNKSFDLKVTILDVNGQIVLARGGTGQASYLFDLSAKARGNYFVKVESKGQTYTWKIILK
jgi:hypothetical protein